MKLNKKGFMMVEVVVVAAIVLGVLTSLYTSYSKVFRRYSEIIDYYNIDGIYKLESIRNDMIASDKNNINNILSLVNKNNYYSDPDTYPGLYIVKTDKIQELNNNGNLNNAYKDYLTYLTNSIKFEKNYVMILEYSKDANSNYYSYLELEA